MENEDGTYILDGVQASQSRCAGSSVHHMIRRLASLPLKNGPGRLACQVAEDEPSVTPKSEDDTGTSHSVKVALQAEGKATRQRGGCDEGVTCMYVNGWERQT